MSKLFKIRLLLIIVLAFTISILAYGFLKDLNDQTTIIIAAQDIDERCWVKPGMLKEVLIRTKDKNILAPNAVTSMKDLEYAITKGKIAKGKVIDKITDIISGTWSSLVDNEVIDQDGQINPSFFTPSNMRLTTVKVDSQGAVFNRIKNGDWVDIVFTSSADGIGNFSVAIMQHIEVFEVEEIKGNAQSQNITLLLSPQQAVDITCAKRSGTLDLILNPKKGEAELLVPANSSKFINNVKGN